MVHFPTSQWVDYVNGVTDLELTSRLSNHERQCPECASLAHLLRRASVAAEADRQFNPPDELVAAAERLFTTPSHPVSLPGTLSERLVRWAGLLVLDSSLDPLPAGSRSSAALPRRLLYRAGRYVIDLQIEPAHLPAGKAGIVGQIATQQRPANPLLGLPVRLTSGVAVIAETQTNEMGEFVLDFDESRSLGLYIKCDSEELFVTLPERC